MSLPNSGQITFLMIRNEYYGFPEYGTSDTNLYNLNYYKGKTRWFVGGVANVFPSGAIAFTDFHGSSATDPNPPPPPPGDGGGDGGG